MLYLLHCWAGIDRTGVAAGAYAMTYQNLSGPESLRLNNRIAERAQHDKHIYDLIWYCYWLSEQTSTELNCNQMDKVKDKT